MADSDRTHCLACVVSANVHTSLLADQCKSIWNTHTEKEKKANGSFCEYIALPLASMTAFHPDVISKPHDCMHYGREGEMQCGSVRAAIEDRQRNKSAVWFRGCALGHKGRQKRVFENVRMIKASQSGAHVQEKASQMFL